jgi:hypothetical protein
LGGGYGHKKKLKLDKYQLGKDEIRNLWSTALWVRLSKKGHGLSLRPA